MALTIFKKPRVAPGALFTRMHQTILGTGYTLSIIFTTSSMMKKLNARYRKKNAPTDILSFALDKTSGELYLSLSEIASHAKKFGMTQSAYLPYLVIHGILHLKGLDHGRTMEKSEIRYCRAFRLRRPSL